MLAQQALAWFKLDRLTLFPNFRDGVLDTGKSMSVSQVRVLHSRMGFVSKKATTLNITAFTYKSVGEAASEQSLSSTRSITTWARHHEGAHWHAIVSLPRYLGNNGRALSVSLGSAALLLPIEERDLKRIKMLVMFGSVFGNTQKRGSTVVWCLGMTVMVVISAKFEKLWYFAKTMRAAAHLHPDWRITHR
ncbi:hypothetical protein OH492_17390 [Vibrio chagasii]|nr:hypothetical protein [Vibrio chagasii]